MIHSSSKFILDFIVPLGNSRILDQIQIELLSERTQVYMVPLCCVWGIRRELGSGGWDYEFRNGKRWD